MAEETLRDFLVRRERELGARIAALKGQLSPLEAELAQIQEARSRNRVQLQTPDISQQPKFPWVDDALASQRQAQGKFEEMTIKELIVQALIDAFPQGATSVDLKAFIRDGYARSIEAGSLRAQLHRMKASGILVQESPNDTWNFCNGKRHLYARYDHPSSRKAMIELQDDPGDSALLREAKKLAWKDEPEKG